MKAIITTCAVAALIAPAMGMEWSTDFESAKKQAMAADKCLLLHFTGSDWCGHCIRQHADVFSKPEFQSYVQQKLVPVEVDIPSRKPMSTEQRQKNERLCEAFGVSGFPTILVLSPAGEVVGGYVGNAGTPAHAIAQLEAGVTNAANWKKAEALSGAERLQALHAVYTAMPAKLRSKAATLRQQIVELDKEDTTGLRAEMRAEQQLFSLLSQIETASPAQVVALVDAYLPKAEPANKVPMVQMKMNALLVLAETQEDILKVVELGESIVDQAPGMAPTLQRMRSNPQLILEQLKKGRNR